jgi:branched-chain amino acid transport system substrate-binding protein
MVYMENSMVIARTISCLMFQLVLFLTVVLSSCSESKSPLEKCVDAIGCVTVGPGEPVKIGVLQALTGKVATFGWAQVRGLKLALEKRNNTLLGHPVVLQLENTGCTEEGGANAALKLIADPQTIAIFGSTCSSAGAAASQIMSPAGLTMISGSNSAPFLTSIAGQAAPNWQAGYFRTVPNEEYAGRAAAGYAFQQLGLQRAATIHDNDIYSKGLTESFKKAFLALGGEIVLEASINKGETEMEPVLTAVIKSGAQLLFFPLLQPEGDYILRQARALPALDATLLISGSALFGKGFLDEVGEAGIGMCFVGPSYPEGVVVDQLAAAYEMKFKKKPEVTFYIYGFDAADLLLHAVERTAIQHRDGILHLGRKALRDTLYATTGFEGVSGTLNCNQFGDCARPAFNVVCLEKPSQGLIGLQSNIVFSYTAPGGTTE